MKKGETAPPKIRSHSELERIRERVRSSLELDKGVRIVVGLGTCGLAAGAQQVYDTISATPTSMLWSRPPPVSGQV